MFNYKWALGTLLALAACSPFEENKPDTGLPPTPDQVSFSYAPTSRSTNVIEFENTSEVGFTAVWDFGNGSTAQGDKVEAEFPFKGDYKVTLTIMNNGGKASNSQIITLEQDDLSLVESDEYKFLTGGVEALNGKNWVVDKTRPGHMANSESADKVEWWSAGPLEKEGTGLYTDVYNFNIFGSVYTHTTNGKVFVNGAYGDDFTNTEPQEDDYSAAYEDYQATWGLVEKEDGYYIVLSNGADKAWLGYYAGPTEYKILNLEENELYVSFFDAKMNGYWFHRLIPEGYEPDPLPETPEYDYSNFSQDFENPDFEWGPFPMDMPNFEIISNPAPDEVNSSGTVGKYVTDEGVQWQKLPILFDNKVDLSVKNKVKMKVYFPLDNSYDNFEVGGERNPLNTTAAVWFQNRESGEPWTSEVKLTQTVEQGDQWVELEFDFSQWVGPTEFDQLWIILGNEGHFKASTFYLDDIEIL
ncbi:PKD domain-containing protein [Xanthovirga aplysinae]|uniref:PKD domain-containing protein n=1 Tax=Xanthovirga aplysinae TaxID=2529853 RepID=UPI0012BD50BB|nr:PKD domain-containing protein [Xanthovirga aplysinae]MTI31779.1 hypothetical protein [Xanthovirga aplysinae]